MGKYILVTLYLLLANGGMVLIKLGDAFHLNLQKGTFHFAMTWVSMIGFVCYIASFLMFSKIITMFELSFISPVLVGLSQIVVLLAAIFVFRERMDVFRIAGIALILGGVVLMNVKN